VHRDELLLGKQVPMVNHYAPELLFPIPRREARDALGLERAAALRGGGHLARL
jgi:NADPH-dependent 7-cyano-7-deazaguanine reductase QueF-like protein